MNQPPILRIVPRDTEEEPHQAPDPGHSDALAIQTGFLVLLREHTLLVDDPQLLAALWPWALPPDPHEMRAHIEVMVEERLIRRVYIGPQPHLALVHERPLPPRIILNPTQTPAPPQDPQTAPTAAHEDRSNTEQATVSKQNTVSNPQTAADEDLEAFKLDVAVDAEHEKALLLKVIVTLEVIAAFVMLRELLLWYFHL